MADVTWAVVDLHSAGRAVGLVVKCGHAKPLIMKTLFRRVVQVIKSDRVDYLGDTKLLDLFISEKRESDACKPVFRRQSFLRL